MEKYAPGYCYLQRAKCGPDPIGDTQAAMLWLERAVQEGSRAAGRFWRSWADQRQADHIRPPL